MHSLKSRVALNIGVIILISGVSVPFFILFGLSDRVSEVILEKNRLIAGEITIRVEQYVDDRKTDVLQAAHFIEWLARNQGEFPKNRELLPERDDVAFVQAYDLEENLVFEYGELYKSAVPENARAIFLRAKESADIIWFDTKIHDQRGSPYLGKAIRTEHFVVILYHTVDKLQLYTDKTSFTENSCVLIIDRQGLVVSSKNWDIPSDAQNMDGEPIFTFTRDKNGDITLIKKDGERCWAEVRTIAETGWTVIVAEPLSTTMNEVIPIVAVSLWTTIVLICFSILIFFFSMRSVFKAIDSLTETTRLYASGDYTAVPKPADYLEFDALRSSFISMGRAIAAREETLKQERNDKEILLKEIHHRVKNNLQIITSLLNLQETYLYDERDADLFQKSKLRISSMALVHEKLYLSENPSEINMKEYIETLLDIVRVSVGEKSVIAHVLGKEVFLPLGTAIPCALIILELVMNAIKHGAPPGDTPIVQIIFDSDCKEITALNNSSKNAEKPSESYCITVRDNGPGIPDDAVEKALNGNSLGFTLINALARQIQGSLDYKNDGGAVFTLIIPRSQYIEK